MKNFSPGRLGRLFLNAVTPECRSPGSIVPSHAVTLESCSPGSVVMKKGKTTDAGTLRAARHSSMTLCDERRSGFTLIELLVVVLIIGILAAVALPQYQAAVTRTRLAELQILTRSIKDAEERYFMANGEYTNAFSDLDISLPGTGIPNVAEYWKPTDQAGMSIASIAKAGLTSAAGRFGWIGLRMHRKLSVMLTRKIKQRKKPV
mgnify:CR=1 FL=1